jgi:hypothetical protein
MTVDLHKVLALRGTGKGLRAYLEKVVPGRYKERDPILNPNAYGFMAEVVDASSGEEQIAAHIGEFSKSAGFSCEPDDRGFYKLQRGDIKHLVKVTRESDILVVTVDFDTTTD